MLVCKCFKIGKWLSFYSSLVSVLLYTLGLALICSINYHLSDTISNNNENNNISNQSIIIIAFLRESILENLHLSLIRVKFLPRFSFFQNHRNCTKRIPDKWCSFVHFASIYNLFIPNSPLLTIFLELLIRVFEYIFKDMN